MIIKDIENLRGKDHHVIIIGSGPAGISTALTLEKKNIKSIIIEAGGVLQDNDSKKFLNGVVEGHKYNNLEISRLRQFGGTSGIWGGFCNPMKKDDLIGWPISTGELNNFNTETKKILNLHYKKDFFFEKFSKNLDIYNLIWSNVKFGDEYLEHIKKSKYISLSLNTNFLNFEGTKKGIKFIKCKKNNIEFNLKSKFYILSCGGIENSRMLLWSKKLNKNIFDPRIPLGEYYMDHPYHSVGSGLINYKKLISYFENNSIINEPTLTCNENMYISCNKSFLKKKNILNSGVYINFTKVDEENDLFKQLRCVAPNFIKKLYENSKIKENYQINIDIIQEQKALKENRIELAQSLDPLNIPLAKLYWRINDLEKKSARFILEDIAKVLVDNDIGRIAINEKLYNKNDYEVLVGNHQIGGTRIGENINDSVVDKDLKVHNLDNLFINGSSVFRTSGHSHPTYTIVKLAVRLGNHLSKLIN